MPNVRVLSLKKSIPRVSSKTRLEEMIDTFQESGWGTATFGYWPFGTFRNDEDAYDLQACMFARATQWEVVTDFSWSGSGTAGDFTAHIRGSGLSDVTVEDQRFLYTTFAPFVSGVELVNEGVFPTVVEEESMVHSDSRLEFENFTGAWLSDRSYIFEPGGIDYSADLTISGADLTTRFAVFGGPYIAPSFKLLLSAGWVLGPSPVNDLRSYSGSPPYTETLDLPTVSTDKTIFPLAAECGTATIIWYHKDGGQRSITCPIYCVNLAVMTGSGSRTVSCNVTITQTQGFQYGGIYEPSGEKI